MSAPPRSTHSGKGRGGRSRRGGRGGQNRQIQIQNQNRQIQIQNQQRHYSQPSDPRMSTAMLLSKRDYKKALPLFEEELRLAVRGAIRVNALDGVGMEIPIAVRSFARDDVIELYCDGASRGNPGAAGYGGFFVNRSALNRNSNAAEDPDDAVDAIESQIVYEYSHYLGYGTTNNEAEYSAVLCGMKYASKLGVRHLIVHSDSLLVVNHCTNTWRVRELHLQEYHRDVRQMKGRFQQVQFKYIPREQNQRADRLANEGINTANQHQANLSSGILPFPPTRRLVKLLATVAETRSLLLLQFVRHGKWQEGLGMAPRYGIEIRGAQTAADSLFAAEAASSSSVSSTNSNQKLAQTVSMVWDTHDASLREVQREYDQLSLALKPMAQSREEARHRVGEARWNSNKPLEAQSSHAERRNAVVKKLKVVEQLKQEMEQTSENAL